MTSPEVSRLASMVADLQEQVAALSRESRLSHASMEGGGISVYQPGTGGLPGVTLGQQYDGTFGAPPVSGPVPPQPTGITVRTIGETLVVTWDGTFANAMVAPLDYTRTEVHVGQTPDFDALAWDSLKNTFETPRGGELSIYGLPMDTDLYVKLVVRSASGKFSPPSGAIGPVQVHRLGVENIDVEGIGGNMIYRGPDAPTDPQRIGNLWLKQVGTANGQPQYETRQWDGDSWELTPSQLVTQALADAFTANQTAVDAGNAALVAQQAAGNAVTTANQANEAAQAAMDAARLAQQSSGTGINVYRQTSAPTGGTYHINDLWLDTAHSNMLYAWSGSAWVASDDQRIATALTNASTAQSTAVGKTTLYAQVSAPATTGRAVGDTWIDTDDSNKVYVWTGSAWTPTLFGSGAISATARQLGAVTTYRQASAPTGTLIAGDLWIDSATNKLYSYSGSAWVASQDVGIQQALTAAGTAQSTANAKITSYYQTSAPTTGMSAGDFWLDTGNGNKLYRYSGTAWVLSQDTAIQSALTNAGTAQATADKKVQVFYSGTAPTTGMAIGDLWIDTANGNRMSRYSGAAWAITQDTAIQTALTTAGGKTTTFYQTSAPTTTGRVTGDLWIDTSNGNKIYTWSSGAWTATALSSQALNVTARQLGAITIYRQTSAPATGMIAGDYWIDSSPTGGNKAYMYVASSWTLVQDTSITAALTNAATAQATADSKVRIFIQTSAPTGLNASTDVGDEWIDTGNGNKVSTWGGSSWIPRQWGNAAIAPASLVASDVVATGTVTAALLQSVLVLATTIIAGDPKGDHVQINQTGMRVFRGDVNGDGVPDEAVRLGVAGAADRLAIVANDGSLAFVADETGYVTASGLSVLQPPRIAAADYTGRGGTFYEILDRRPRGIVSRGLDTGRYDFNTTSGRGIFDISARLFYNRLYKICVRLRVNGSVANDALAEIGIRYESTGDGTPTSPPSPAVPAAPSINSPLAGRLQVSTARPEAQGIDFSKPFSMGFGATGSFRDYRFLLTVSRPVGSTTLTVWGDLPDGIEMWVEDIGPYVDTAQTANAGGGTASNPGPPPAAQQTRYSRTWVANWLQNWNGSGVGAGVGDGAYQGLDPSGNNGNQRSYVGFSGLATDGSGLTMDAALAGARIEEIGLYIYYPHWYSYAGGEAVVGFHGFRNPAPAWGGGDEWMVGVPGWRRAEGRWLSLGGYLGATQLQKFATGVWKGILLGAATAGNYDHYGRANAEGSMQLNVTYWR